MAAEPQRINDAWWARQPNGQWLRFDDVRQEWVPDASPVPEEATVVVPPLPPVQEVAGNVGQSFETPVEARPVSRSPFGGHSQPAGTASAQPLGAGGSKQQVAMPASFAQAPVVLWLVIGAAVLVVVGSLGPWAKVFVFTVNGTDGDGTYTLVMGLVAGGLAVARAMGRGPGWLLIVSAVLFGLCALTGVIDWADLESTAGGDEDFGDVVSVGWGLVVMTIAAVVGVVVSVLAIRAKPQAMLAE